MIKKNKFDTSIQLIRELYHINICQLNDTANILNFVNQFHIHKTQSAISAENLHKIIDDYPYETIYLTDCFMINYIIFRIAEYPMILGPFCSIMLSSHDVWTILKRNRITDLTVNDFFSHYNSFPVLTESQSLHIVESLQNVVDDTVQVKVHKLNTSADHYATDISYSSKREDDVELLEKRYSFEQHFMLNIEKGNARSAIFDLHNMQADVQHLKQLGTTLESEKIGAAITRTTVRLAAMNAGLPIFLIDQISKKNTITSFHAKTVDEILQAKEKMIREFCTAILESQTKHYSATVQSMLYFFEHNYYADTSLDEISKELSLSKNHIISEFKKETGFTPMAYLKKVRLKQASVLLTGTNFSIQEISESVGIPDANYFIKLFKKEYNITPLLYKKKFS